MYAGSFGSDVPTPQHPYSISSSSSSSASSLSLKTKPGRGGEKRPRDPDIKPEPVSSSKHGAAGSDSEGGDEDGVSKEKKGLRHFSLKVCEKVRQLKVTSYNKVADDLVAELTSPESQRMLQGEGKRGKKLYDEKNIRRRVYDALNVLMAMGIICKEKKLITWIGLPSCMADDRRQSKEAAEARVRQKQKALTELLTQHVCCKNLARRNSDVSRDVPDESRLHPPFIVVSAAPDTVVQCDMSADKKHMIFSFSGPFAVNEDKDILRMMDLPRVAPWDLSRLLPSECCEYYPKELVGSQHARGGPRYASQSQY
jgi:hypothetical protein